MSNLFVILKYNLLQYFNKISSRFSKNKKSTIGGGIIFSALGIILYGLLIYYIYLFAYLFSETSKKDGVLLLVVAITSLLTFTSTLTKANSTLFRMKDYDLLFSLPVKNKDILMSKLVLLIGINPIISLLVGIPTCVFYQMFNPSENLNWLSSLVLFIFIPIIPTIIGSFIAYLLGFIPLKQKVRNVLSTLLYIAFLLVVMTFSMSISTDEAQLLNRLEGTYNSLEKAYFLASVVVLGIKGNLRCVFLFCGLSLILLIAFITIVSLTFNKIISFINLKQQAKSVKNKQVIYKETSVLKALCKKELIFYLNTPSYILNTIVGPIMSIIVTIFTQLSLNDANIDQGLYCTLLTSIYIFSFGITSTASSSISLEGKSFWILKSSPINEKNIFTAKTILGLITTMPFLLIDMIILMILTNISILDIFLLFVGTALFINFIVLLGVYINIKRHDFMIEQIKAIKNSSPVVINMIVTFLLMFVSTTTAVVFYLLFGTTISLLSSIMLNATLLMIIILLIKKDGIRTFTNIEF